MFIITHRQTFNLTLTTASDGILDISYFLHQMCRQKFSRPTLITHYRKCTKNVGLQLQEIAARGRLLALCRLRGGGASGARSVVCEKFLFAARILLKAFI